jgi:hypothetical protein
MIGDHSKLAIATHLMAGTYIGYNCMIATSKYAPRFVPSYSFVTDAGIEPYRTDKATGMMQEVFNRRQRTWSETDDLMNRFALETAKAVEKPM